MRYVELLSRIEPATSAYIGIMQNNGKDQSNGKGKSLKCGTCRGKKRVKLPAAQGSAKYEICPRCHGDGLMSNVSGRSTQSFKSPEAMPIERIAFCTRDIEKRYLIAAFVHVTHNPDLRRKLEPEVAEHIIRPESSRWKLTPEAQSIRIMGLSRVVTTKFVMPNTPEWMPAELGAQLMCCSLKDFERTWMKNAMNMHDKLQGWVALTNEKMRQNDVEESEAA